MNIFFIFETFFLLALSLSKLFTFSSMTSRDQSILIQRWSTNFSFEIINKLLVFSLFLWPIKYLTFNNSNDSLLYFFLYLLTLDFIFYWRHRFYHRWIWPIHKAHHSDEGYDFTLSLRVHPIETVIQIALFILVSKTGNVSKWQFNLAAQLFTIQALLSHLEVILPHNNFTRFLREIIIVSQDHRQHHDPLKYNCNFGFMFSFWDTLFKTRRRT